MIKLPFVSKKRYDEVVEKLECLLCHATGGKLSYHTYPLGVMESCVNDHIQDCCDQAVDEALEEAKESLEQLRSKH